MICIIYIMIMWVIIINNWSTCLHKRFHKRSVRIISNASNTVENNIWSHITIQKYISFLKNESSVELITCVPVFLNINKECYK